MFQNMLKRRISNFNCSRSEWSNRSIRQIATVMLKGQHARCYAVGRGGPTTMSQRPQTPQQQQYQNSNRPPASNSNNSSPAKYQGPRFAAPRPAPPPPPPVPQVKKHPKRLSNQEIIAVPALATGAFRLVDLDGENVGVFGLKSGSEAAKAYAEDQPKIDMPATSSMNHILNSLNLESHCLVLIRCELYKVWEAEAAANAEGVGGGKAKKSSSQMVESKEGGGDLPVVRIYPLEEWNQKVQEYLDGEHALNQERQALALLKSKNRRGNVRAVSSSTGKKVKEMDFGSNITLHDFGNKMKKIRELLTKGHDVKMELSQSKAVSSTKIGGTGGSSLPDLYRRVLEGIEGVGKIGGKAVMAANKKKMTFSLASLSTSVGKTPAS